MALFKSDKYGNKQPAISRTQRGAIVVDEETVALPNTLAANDVAVLCPIPPGHKIVDAILFATDLDTNGVPTVVVSVGIFNDNDAAPNLVANQDLLTASTVAQAGGMARAAVVAGLTLPASDAKRWVALKVDTVAATKAAGTVTLRLLTQAA